MRRARVRQTPAAKDEPARHAVDRAEVDERAAPRRLAEDLDRECRLPQHRLQRVAGETVELREAEARLRGDAAPHRLDGPVGRLQGSERPLDGLILDGDRRDGGHREDSGADRDPDRCEHVPLGVRP